MTKGNSNIIGPKVSSSRSDISGVFDTFDQVHLTKSNLWPLPKAITNIASSTGTGTDGVNQVSSKTHTWDITGQGFDGGAETLYWTVSVPTQSSFNTAFFASTSGSFTMGTSNSGSFSVLIYWSSSIERGRYGDYTQNYDMEIRSGSTSGPILATKNFTITNFALTEARFNDGAASLAESTSTSNIYWDWRGSGAGDSTTGDDCSYERGPNFLAAGTNPGSATYSNSGTNMIIETGTGVSAYPYKCFNTNTSGTAYKEFTWTGGSSTIEFRTLLTSAVTSSDSVKLYKGGVLQHTISGTSSSVEVVDTISVTTDDVLKVEYNNVSGTAIRVAEIRVHSQNSTYRANDADSVLDIGGEDSGIAAVTYIQNGTTNYRDNMYAVADFTTEGTEPWYQRVTHLSRVGKEVLGWDYIDITDASRTPNVTVTANTTSINEGGSVDITVTDASTDFLAGGFYYTLTGTNITAADFSTNSLTGTITTSGLTNGTATFTVTTSLNDAAEGTESFQVQIRQGSTGGSIIGTSPSISVANVVPNMTNAIVSLGTINIVTTTSTADYTGNFDVIDISVPSTYSGSARIYLGFRITAPTTYVNDICVGAVQHLNSSANTLKNGWSWGTNSSTSQSWQYTSGQLYTNAGDSFSSIVSRTWLTLGATDSYTRISTASHTGSSYTGANGGVSPNYGSCSASLTILPTGNNSVPQVTNVTTGDGYYIYREASGSTRYTTAWCRSPSVTFAGSDKIRVCYNLTQNSYQATYSDPSNSLLIFIA